jgi:diguanylate cyclase (GGDEF)-like protein
MPTKKELEEELNRLRPLVFKDELTGLYNRRGFYKESKKFLDELKLSSNLKERRINFIIKNFGVVIFDVDDFKQINDKYGHDTGDKALQNLARAILDRVREIDISARWGGEEIVLGLIGANEQDAFLVAESIREHIVDDFDFTISGGVSAFNEAVTVDDLIHEADQALYKAKRTGKNKIIKFSELKKHDRKTSP